MNGGWMGGLFQNYRKDSCRCTSLFLSTFGGRYDSLLSYTTTITPRELELIAPLSDLDGVVMSPPPICFSWFVCLCAEINEWTYVAFSCPVSLVFLVENNSLAF